MTRNFHVLCNILKFNEAPMLRKALPGSSANISPFSFSFSHDRSTKVQYGKLSLNNVASIYSLVRHMSMWPKGFEDPAAHKRDFPALRNSGEFETKALSPIKSAPSTATCSMFKDPLVQKFHRLCTLHGRAEVTEINLRVCVSIFY